MLSKKHNTPWLAVVLLTACAPREADDPYQQPPVWYSDPGPQGDGPSGGDPMPGDAPPGSDPDVVQSCTTDWCLVPEPPHTVYGLSVSPSGQPWLTGYGVYTYEDDSWTRTELSWTHPTDPFRAYTQLYEVHALSDTNVWVSGEIGYIGQFNGFTWIDRTAAAPTVRGIWGAASNDVWFFYGSGLLHRWQGSDVEYQDSTTVDFVGAWGSSADNLCGFGHAETDSDTPSLYCWNGSTWQQRGLPGPGVVASYWAAPSGEEWAVTQDGYATGTLLHRDGGDWNQIMLPGGQIATAVWGTGADDVWAVGRSGRISHFNGTTWTASASGTTEHLFFVEGGGGMVWAAGSGVILSSR